MRWQGGWFMRDTQSFERQEGMVWYAGLACLS